MHRVEIYSAAQKSSSEIYLLIVETRQSEIIWSYVWI